MTILLKKEKVRAIIKRITDIFFSLVIIIVASPIMIFAALGIKLANDGPVFYKSQRVGRSFRPFVMLKFRTMRVNFDKATYVTPKDDERIFPFGRFLRESKIDELPQLFNILIGQMSFVGPRPEDPDIAEECFVGEYGQICSVKPGLTSPASLLDYTHGENIGNQQEYLSSFLKKKLDVELYYIENATLLYDIEIIIRTILTIGLMVLGKRNFKYPKEYEVLFLRKLARGQQKKFMGGNRL